MAKVYTKTGDKGTTGLYTGERVDKDCARVEAYGNIDEIDSVLGMARAAAVHEEVKQDVYYIQKSLWMLMADVASLNQEAHIKEEQVEELERMIDKYDEKLKPLAAFIVPGETLSAAYLDLARTVTRRAERQMWRLRKEEAVHESNIRYLNRLSDLCFTLARAEAELE